MSSQKTARTSSLIWAACSVAIGLLLLFFPDFVLRFLSVLVGFFCAGFGILRITEGMHRDRNNRGICLFVGVFALLFGMYITVGPGDVVVLFPIAAGTLFLASGVGRVVSGFHLKKNGSGAWIPAFLFGLAFIAGGLFLLVHGYSVVRFSLRLIGIMVLVDGVGDLWLLSAYERAEKDSLQRKMQIHKGIEGEFRDITEEDGSEGETSELSG